MLDYTKAAIKKTIEDFKKIDFARAVITQIIYIAYLIYVVCIQSGVLVANIALLTLACAYFAFFLYMKTRGVKKQVKKAVQKTYKWSKRLIKLFNLGVMIYGLSITASHFTALSLILAALMIVGWVLELLFEVVFRFFLGRAKFILEGMEADYEKLTKPVKTVGNFFKKLAGKEVEPEKEPSKDREILDKMVAKEKAQKEQEKAQERVNRKAKFSLWMQDKLDLFKRKAAPSQEVEISDEQIPAPLEEQAMTEIEVDWNEKI